MPTTSPLPAPPPHRATVIIDYQNVHNIAHDMFGREDEQLHESLIDPLLYAQELIRVRNEGQGEGYEAATLNRVLVYRGLPSSEYEPRANSYNMRQKAHWERDPRVKVMHRPLRYELQRTYDGTPERDEDGRVVINFKEEKGIDVLCALAAVREACNSQTKLVVVASHDSDLEPALDEARGLGTAHVEVSRWHNPESHVWAYRLGGIKNRSTSFWCTALGASSFEASRDKTPYSNL